MLMKNLVGPIKENPLELDPGTVAPAISKPNYYQDSDLTDGPHLKDHWRSVRKHLLLVIIITVFSTLTMAIYMVFKPDIYEAEAQVQVNLENVNPQLSGVKTGSLIVSPVNDPAYFNTQLQLLTRPWLLRRVVKTLDLEHNPSFSTFALGRTKRNDSEATTGAGSSQDGAGQEGASPEELAEATRFEPYVEAIQAGLSVEPVKETRLPIKETRLINIAFSHSDPETAAKVVNAIADTFVRSNLEKKTDLNTTTGAVLQKRIAELQEQVRRGEEQLINYAKSHEILSLDPSQNTVVERLAGLNRQLLEAENERKLAEATYRAVQLPGAADALAAGTGRETAETENRVAELRQRRAQLLVESTEEWPEVKELDQQIAVLEQHLHSTRQRSAAITLTNLETKYRQSLAREEALRSAFNQQRGDTLKQNEAAIFYRIAQQEVDTSKNLLEGLLQRRKENDGLLAAMINNIRVNDYAVVPKRPIGPRRLLYTAVAFALSLAFSLGIAVLTDYMDGTVRSSEDVEKTLHTRTLAAIPSMTEVTARRMLQLPEVLHRRNVNLRDHRHLLLDSNTDSSLTEVYRQLRTTMLLSNAQGTLQTILVTSSMAGEGKTTTAINTALSLAQTGANVLLIDADTRSPRVHRIFNFDNEKGLSSMLATNTIGNRQVLSLLKRHERSGLFVLPAGPPEPNFTELVSDPRMRRLIADLRSTFTYIVIDSPPIAHFADGVVLSQVVDGVLLVINSGKTPRESVQQSYQLLHDVGATIVGVVLNNVKPLPFDYSYYKQPYPVNGQHADSKSIKNRRANEGDSFAETHPLGLHHRIPGSEVSSSDTVPPVSS
jgi:succinoglycan biosynthesis transport protein ExoP